MTPDETAREEEHETKHQTQHGNHQQQGETGLAMHDVADGHARGDTQLHGPEVERQVGDGDNPRTDALGVMLHEPS